MLRIVTPALAALIFTASSAFAASEVGTIISFDRAGGELQLAAVPHPVLKVKAFMLADMIGDKDLGILRDQNSTPWLLDLIAQAAESLGYQSYFFAQTTGVTDDHVPFQQAGAPVADIIDLDYGYNNAFHHTTEDTRDKLSPKSLQITGDVILETFRLINGREH